MTAFRSSESAWVLLKSRKVNVSSIFSSEGQKNERWIIQLGRSSHTTKSFPFRLCFLPSKHQMKGSNPVNHLYMHKYPDVQHFPRENIWVTSWMANFTSEYFGILQMWLMPWNPEQLKFPSSRRTSGPFRICPLPYQTLSSFLLSQTHEELNSKPWKNVLFYKILLKH